MEPTLGLEPRTCCLRNSCSTTELCRRRSSIGAAHGHQLFVCSGVRWRPRTKRWHSARTADNCVRCQHRGLMRQHVGQNMRSCPIPLRAVLRGTVDRRPGPRQAVERWRPLDRPYRQGPMRIDARMASSSAKSAADVPGMCHVSMINRPPLTSTMYTTFSWPLRNPRTSGSEYHVSAFTPGATQVRLTLSAGSHGRFGRQPPAASILGGPHQESNS